MFLLSLFMAVGMMFGFAKIQPTIVSVFFLLWTGLAFGAWFLTMGYAFFVTFDVRQMAENYWNKFYKMAVDDSQVQWIVAITVGGAGMFLGLFANSLWVYVLGAGYFSFAILSLLLVSRPSLSKNWRLVIAAVVLAVFIFMGTPFLPVYQSIGGTLALIGVFYWLGKALEAFDKFEYVLPNI